MLVLRAACLLSDAVVVPSSCCECSGRAKPGRGAWLSTASRIPPNREGPAVKLPPSWDSQLASRQGTPAPHDNDKGQRGAGSLAKDHYNTREAMVWRSEHEVQCATWRAAPPAPGPQGTDAVPVKLTCIAHWRMYYCYDWPCYE